MFHLTAKSQYGVDAVMELVKFYNKNLVQIKDIVESRNIPKNYLEQIFNRLAKNGLISSVRGNKGGYSLSYPPEQISLLDVLEALEGKIEFGSGSQLRTINDIYKELARDISETLNVSLKELWLQEERYVDPVLYEI